jgi:glycosyltransferase involved in cell wall biosynthesis
MRPFLGICAIVKNEGPYIHEWLTYHRAIGVERFTLYDNGSTDDTRAEVARFGHPVDVIDWPGQAQQVPAYRDMLATRRHYAEWVAFIDVDEFLTPRGDDSVPDILDSLPADVGTLYVHWLFFGSSGAPIRMPGGVTERFQRRARVNFAPNRYGKSIVRMSAKPELVTPHLIAAGRVVNMTGDAIPRDGSAPERACHDGIALHHYFTKSLEEWTMRRAQGRPSIPHDHPDAIRSVEQFRSHDRNDVADDTAAAVMAETERATEWACSGNEWLSGLHVAA